MKGVRISVRVRKSCMKVAEGHHIQQSKQACDIGLVWFGATYAHNTAN